MKRIAIVRGPNLNSWEMQNFAPLKNDYEFVAFCSHGNNFDLTEIPFPVQTLWSWGQLLRLRAARRVIERIRGDYHDLVNLEHALRGFDIVHTPETMYYCSYQAALAKRKLGFKLVVTVWENLPFNYNLAATRRLKETVLSEADLLLAVTERAKKTLVLEGAPAEKIAVQMPGIDIKHFRPLPGDRSTLRRFDCHEDDFVILFVAHLTVQKGVFDLLYAMKMLLMRMGSDARVKLLIGGSGPERKRLSRLITQLQLDANVRLIGPHPYSVMPLIHNLADVFVLPSQPALRWQEQFGYVLVESMACGKPVLSTESGSIAEVVGNAGVLVPPNDYLALSRALERLIGSSSLRQELGTKARSRAEEMFDVRRVALQFKNHYENLYRPTKPYA
jgi:glycosyltransferase involved in cell wall biosynthesis